MSETENKETETPAEDNPATTEARVASDEEIRKAKELLKANGYGLIGYKDAGEKVKRTVGAGLGFAKDKWKSFGGWIACKKDEMKAAQEEKKRAVAEKKRVADEAAARRAEFVKNELRLAELRVEEARLKAAAETAKSGMPGSAIPSASPATPAKPDSAAASNAPKCVGCGAELAPGARFCRKCGKPVIQQ